MMVGFERPLAGLAVLLAVLTAILLSRRPSKAYLDKASFLHPLIDYVEGVAYRRPARLLVLEVLAATLLAVAVASPYVERVKTASLEENSLARLHVPARPAVVLVVDVSGSMAGEKLEAAKRALRLLAERLWRLNRSVDVGLIAFSDHVVEAIPPTTNRTEVLEAIERLRAGGGTMYTYPLATAYSWLRVYREFNQTAVIVFATDGLPADRAGYRRVLEKLAAMGVRVFTVFIGSSPEGRREVEYMARVGHGKSYTAATAEELVKIFERIAGEAGKLIENVTATVKLEEKVKVRESLTTPLYAATLAALLALAYARYREAGLAV